MSELQTSHDEIISQIDASNKPSKEEQKKEFQKAFSTLRNIEVMHGKDSQEYAGALTEYTNLKNKIIVEYNIILSQSEAAISSMKDPNSFENKPYAQMSVDEAKTALARLNSKYSGLEEASYTEKALGMLRSGFPSTEGEVTSKRLANIAQENLIKKIVGDTGYNNEFVVGFNNKEGNYLVKISEVEAMLKSESRSITGGNEASQINSRVVANYLKYLSNQAGGDLIGFQKLFIQKFGEKKAKELVELWNNTASTNAKTELEGSGFGKIIENINNIDINNIGENFATLGLMTKEQVDTLGEKITLSGADNLLGELKKGANLAYGGACSATRTILPKKMEEFQASLSGKSGAENELAKSIEDLIAKLHISDEEKAIIRASIKQGLGEVIKGLGSNNQEYIDLPEKISHILQDAFQKAPYTKKLQIKPGQVLSFRALIVQIDYVTKSGELQKLNAQLDAINNQKLLLKKQLEEGKITQSEYDEAIKKLDESYSETATLRNEAYIGTKIAQENFGVSIDEAKKVTSQLEGTKFTIADLDWFLENPKIRIPLLYSDNSSLQHKDILIAILKKLPKNIDRDKTVEFQDISPNLRYKQDVIEAFDGRLTETDISGFPAISFFHSNQHGDSINFGFLSAVLEKSYGEGIHLIIGKIFDFPYKPEEGIELLISLFDYIKDKGELKGSIDTWKDAVPTYILEIDRINKLQIQSSKLEVAKGITEKEIATIFDLLLNRDALYKRLSEEVSMGPKAEVLEGGPQLSSEKAYIKTLDDYIALHGITKEIEGNFLKVLGYYPVEYFRSLGLLLKSNPDLVEKCIKVNLSTVSILTPDQLKNQKTKDAFLSVIKYGSTSEKNSKLQSYDVKRFFVYLDFTTAAEYIHFLRELKQKNFDFTQDADVLGKFAALLTDTKGEITLLNKEDRALFDEISQKSEEKTGINTRIKDIRETFSKLNETDKNEFLGKMRTIIKEKLPNISPKDSADLEMMLKDENWFPKYREKIEALFPNDRAALLDFLKQIADIKIAQSTREAEKIGSESVISSIPKNYPEIYEFSKEKNGYIMVPKKVEESILTFAQNKGIQAQPGESPKEFYTRILQEYFQTYTSITPQDRVRILEISKRMGVVASNKPLSIDPNRALEAARLGKYDELIYSGIAQEYGVTNIFTNVLPASYANPISPSGIIQSVGDNYYLETQSQKIELTKQEAALLANNPEAQANLVDAYNTLSSLGMEKFWEKRTDIFRVIQANESSMMFNVEDGNYMSDTELGRFLRYILKAVDQESGFEWAKRDMSSMTTKQITEFIKKEAYNNAMPIHDEYGDTPITKVFFQKFTKQNAGRASQRIQANEFGNSINT